MGMVIHTCNPALARWRQKDWKFKVILGHIVSSRLVRGT